MVQPWQGLTRQAAETLMGYLVDQNVAASITGDGAILSSAWFAPWQDMIVRVMTGEVEAGRAREVV